MLSTKGEPASSISSVRGDVPPFVPHRLLRGAHSQTIAAGYLPGRRVALGSEAHRVVLTDGDALSVLESIPANWKREGPIAILVHGLAGCAQSPFVRRTADRLLAGGVRVVRMNLRNAGSGFGLARGTYHAGRVEDLRAVASWTAERAPGSPIAFVGFSLGGCLVLNLAASAAERPVEGLDCVLAASPPLDLRQCCDRIRQPELRLYDRNFVRSLRKQVKRLHRRFPDLGEVDWGRVRTLYDFDDRYTAPRHGFQDAEDYYERNSSGPRVPEIRLPGLIVHAEDDPFIPSGPLRRVQCHGCLELELVPAGGHLGFIAQQPWGPDRRWLEARLTAWLLSRWGLRRLDRPSVPDRKRPT